MPFIESNQLCERKAWRARLKSDQVTRTPGNCSVSQHYHICFRRWPQTEECQRKTLYTDSVRHFLGLQGWAFWDCNVWLIQQRQQFLTRNFCICLSNLLRTQGILSLPLWEAVVVANPSLRGTTTGPFKETYVRTTTKIQARYRIDSQAHMCQSWAYQNCLDMAATQVSSFSQIFTNNRGCICPNKAQHYLT